MPLPPFRTRKHEIYIVSYLAIKLKSPTFHISKFDTETQVKEIINSSWETHPRTVENHV